MFCVTVHNAAAGLLLWAQQAEDIDSIVVADVSQHSAFSSRVEQCHLVS